MQSHKPAIAALLDYIAFWRVLLFLFLTARWDDARYDVVSSVES